MKKLIILLAFTYFYFTTYSSIFANANLMIVNQVRGNECCDPGSTANLEFQMKTLNQLNLPANFLWRYDALKNPEFSKFLTDIPQNNFNHGLWVEITPSLAKDAQVIYHDEIKNWYKAENSLLVGYSLKDRIKLINTLTKEFKNIFKKNPLIAGAWGIDTASLNLLYNKFGVKIWQNVREQFGLDSYSTIGAPVHYPYKASYNWHLIPDSDIENKVLIIRNAITDPLYSYGDTTSSYTSQPNDYTLTGKKIDYFLDLLNQIIEQPESQIGWGVVGLENSIEEKFQNDFKKQLEIIKEKQNNQKIKVLNITQVLDFYKKNKINIYTGKDLINQTNNKAYWITTSFYQLRIRVQNNEIFINDIRAYDSEFTDPYQTKIAQNSLWEIIPAIIDDSLHLNKIQHTNTKFYDVQSDFQIINKGFKLPKIKNLNSPIWQKINNESWQLSYFNQENKEVKINFNLDDWQSNFKLEKINIENNFPFDNKDWTSQQIEKLKNNNYNFKFQTNSKKLESARNNFSFILFPEIQTITPDNNNSTLIIKNKFAQAGRNPIRLVFYPTDKNSFPIIPKNWKIKTTPQIQTTIIPGKKEVQYIDLNNLKYQKVKVDLIINNQITQSHNVYFVENCFKSFDNCQFWPNKWFNFLKLKISDKLRK